MQVNRESRQVRYFGVGARRSDARYTRYNTITIRHGAIGRLSSQESTHAIEQTNTNRGEAKGYSSEGGSSSKGYRVGEECVAECATGVVLVKGVLQKRRR